jgi:transcription-repair coupling factor (superfamily II helicase)
MPASLASSGSSDALGSRARPRAAAAARARRSAQDAERLREEIAWFDPSCACIACPTGRSLPYDQFSPHPDLVSERLATLWQFANGDFDVGIVPVTTALQRLPPRAYLAGPHLPAEGEDALDLEALRAQLVLAGYAHVQQVMSPGEFCVRGGVNRPLPHGQRGAVPPRPPRRRDRDDPHLRHGHAALDLPGARRAHAAGARIPARRREPRALSASRFASASRAIPPRAASTRTSPTASRPRESRATCRSSSRPPRRSSTTCRRARRSSCTATSPAAAEAFWKDLKSRYDLLRGDRDRPLLEPRELYLPWRSCSSR